MASFGQAVVGLWAGFCVFAFDWRLGLGWLLVGLFVSSVKE